MNLLKEKFARHVLLQYISTAAKSYILNYMWTAANFIIESRRLSPLQYAVTKNLQHIIIPQNSSSQDAVMAFSLDAF